MAHHLTILLGLLGIKCGELHGNLKQTDRLLALKKFRDQEIDILIATDVAARGLDIKGVKTVINYTLPSRYTRYVHRVGRTARAGHCGRSISLAGEGEFPRLKEIKKYSRSAMFERVLNKDVLAKYTAKVERLGPAVKRVLAEEQQEEQLASMEQSIRSMEKKLQAGGKDEDMDGPRPAQAQRTWFQTDEEIKKKTKKRALKGKAKAAVEKAKRRMKARKDAEDPEERRVREEVGWAQRQAKRANKLKRLALQDDTDVPASQPANVARGKKRKGQMSSFDQELTRTDRRSIKKFRSGPSFHERREAFEKKNPGQKFNLKKKRK